MEWFKGTKAVGVLSALALGIFPYVISDHLFYGSVNAKYFFVLTLVSALGLWFSYRIFTGTHKFSCRGRWLLLLLVLTLAVSYASGALGVFPARSFFAEILRSTGLFFLSYVALLSFLLSEVLNEKDWSLLRRSVALSSGLFAFLTILGTRGLGLNETILGANFGNTGITLGSETFAGVYLLLGFVVTLIEFFRSSARREQYLFGAMLLLQFFSPLFINVQALFGGDVAGWLYHPLSLVGGARSSSITIVLLLGYLLGVLGIRQWGEARLRSYLYGGWGALWLLGIAMLIGLLFVPESLVQNRYIKESSAARIIVWEAGIEAFKERPLFGWGPENFRFAFDQHFDNQLYLDENLGEIWFDRAHNLFIDTLVSVGMLGAIVYVLFSLCAVAVAVAAARAKLISSLEAHALGALVVAHILQLQTAFDTVGTFALGGVILGYVLHLERNISPSPFPVSTIQYRIAGVTLALLIAIASVPVLMGEYRRQSALYRIFVTPDSAQQEAYIRVALSQESDFETYHLAASALVKGLLAEIARGEEGNLASARRLADGVIQLGIYEDAFRMYVDKHPQDYRARINFVNILFTKTILGEDKLAEAKAIIAGSYALSPENPLTYAMGALAELYGGDIPAARKKIAEGIALNPNIQFTKKVAEHIERQAAQFPEITVLKLENL